jgi:DNA-binding PadR family transcriptional regulator
MRSPVNWALLGLIIERESYAFELAQRFQVMYEGTLPLSSTSHIYTALGSLQERKLIEQTPGLRSGRQPKPSYRATGQGIERYADWLVSSVQEDRRRQALFVLGLAALAENTAWVDEILDRCERAWREHETEGVPSNLEGLPDGSGRELSDRLVAAENELTTAAKLEWLRKVREAVAGDGASGGVD